MIIPKKTLKKWGTLRQEGDIPEIAKAIGKSEPTVYRIFKTGEAKVETVEKLAAFFKTRRKRIAAAISDDDQN